LDVSPRPEGVFVFNDVVAIGAVRAVRDAGLHVPDDIAVVGFDDIPLASFCDPTLTTIRQPVDLMGKAAAELMLDLISGRPPDKRHLKPTVIVRDSA